MFGKKKENEASEPTIADVFYLLSLLVEKEGIDFGGDGETVDEETKTEEKVEENAVVDTDKFFKEELEEGDHDDSIKENEDHTDKRKLIDEIGGILKGKVDDELWRTIIGKAEKIAYEGSETSSKDNSCRNEVEDKDDDKSKKTDTEKQEDKQKSTGDNELKKDAEKRPIFNSIIQSLRQPVKNSYLTRNERIAEANKKYSLN